MTMKTPATENEYTKLEKANYTENNIWIDEMKQNIFRELSRITNTDRKGRYNIKNIKWGK